MLKITLKSLKNTLLVFSLFVAFSCSEEPTEPTNGVDGLDGFNALVVVENEDPGENCSTGGVKISVGQDANDNSTLDSDEIESVSFVCNGSSGNDGSSGPILVARTSPEEPGFNCEAGGTLVEIGADTNDNAALDDSEVQTSFYVCNGNDGADGGSGGVNGLTSLIRATPSISCENGGITIEIGLDDDDSGSLDIGEVDATYDICNGTDGAGGTNGTDGLTTLSNVITESPGVNCTNGGIRVLLGIDTNNNGILDAGEVVSDNYVCNGQNGNDGADGSDGVNGISSITRATAEAAGINCTNGGLKIEIGMDDVTTDGTLQNEEVDYTYYVCNGADGTNGSDGADGNDGVSTFVRTTNEPNGANCANGGVKIELGLDANGNQIFDSGEEFGSPIYVCSGNDGANGSDGADGVDGKSVIVTTAPAGAACANGGTTLTFGYDNNGDGDLADSGIDEVLTTYSICNGLNGSDGADGTDGANGYNTIISTSTENPGTNCTNGGLAIQVGLDMNRNNNIDAGEEVGTYYVCNGADGTDGSNGQNSLVDITSFSGAANGCTNGGLIIRTGIDDNGNGVLNVPVEVDDTQYVCNGTNGTDGADGNSDSVYEFYFTEGLSNYSGVVDVTINGQDVNEFGASMSVDIGAEANMTSNSLLYFPKLKETVESTVKDPYQVVEAVLYLKPVVLDDKATPPSSENWIGVKTLTKDAPLVGEGKATWTTSDGSTPWSSPGAAITEAGGANAYSDMYRLPAGFWFEGAIPFLISRSEVSQWLTDPDTNKGMVVTIVDDRIQYRIDLASSSYDGDLYSRPTLYIKVTTNTGGRISSQDEYYKYWQSLTYEEKLAPLRNRD